MESYVDIVSQAFQATLAPALVVAAGFLFQASHAKTTSNTLINVSRRFLLPSLLLTTLASSSAITWHKLLSYWPVIVFALIPHVLSLALSLALVRFAKSPSWLIETMTYNK